MMVLLSPASDAGTPIYIWCRCILAAADAFAAADDADTPADAAFNRPSCWYS